MKIVEKKFRGSQLCRVLSYPIAYAIARLLLEGGPLDLDDIVKEVKRSKSTVCHHLSKLRLANVIRFDKARRITKYWVKYPEELKYFFKACDRVIARMTARLKQDF